MARADIGRALVAAVGVALATAGAALAVGPWPGLAPGVSSDGVRYTAVAKDGSTTVRATRSGRVVATATIAGTYGVPAVTSTGLAGGLSHDGRLLVLAEPSGATLRAKSRFLVLSTDTLAVRARVALAGEYGFDALSPDGRTLYVLHHASQNDLVRYVVRAYDLRQGALLPGAIVDKREPDETMRGYPVARATSARGRWVYTLYRRAEGGSEPFIHALDAANRTAFCIDLPWEASDTQVWGARLALAAGDRKLLVRSGGRTVATVDTKTLSVRS